MDRLRALSGEQVCAILEQQGFAAIRQKGSNFRLPKVLSQQQVAKLIASATTPFYRIILMALYATGLRRAELPQLKVSGIDSERMMIHVKGGKDTRIARSC